ncbi:MAG: hypothetical protein NVS2B14_01320 [Chamaesiphon sp.]
MGHQSVSDEKVLEGKKDELNTLGTPSERQNDFENALELDSPRTKVDRDSQRRWVVPLVVGIGIGLVIAVGGIGLASKSGKPQAHPTPTAVLPQVSVTVATAEMTSIVHTLDATGTVAAKELIPVLPQTIGLQIKEVAVKEGEAVQAGQLMAILDNSVLQTQLSQALAQLDSSKSALQQKQAAVGQAQAAVGQAQATLAQNRANLGQAERSFKRYQYLAERGAISTQDLDTRSTTVTTAAETARVAEAGISSAEANVRSAEANVKSAEADVRNSEAHVQQIKTQLGQAQVLAPASGIVVAPSADGRQSLVWEIRLGVKRSYVSSTIAVLNSKPKFQLTSLKKYQ